VARTFETPAFRGMTFYEVHEVDYQRRSRQLRCHFRLTIDRYRACGHESGS